MDSANKASDHDQSEAVGAAPERASREEQHKFESRSPEAVNPWNYLNPIGESELEALSRGEVPERVRTACERLVRP